MFDLAVEEDRSAPSTARYACDRPDHFLGSTAIKTYGSREAGIERVAITTTSRGYAIPIDFSGLGSEIASELPNYYACAMQILAGARIFALSSGFTAAQELEIGEKT